MHEDVSDLRDVVDAINRLCDTMKTSHYDEVSDELIDYSVDELDDRPGEPIESYADANVPVNYAERNAPVSYAEPDVPIRSYVERNVPVSYAEPNVPPASYVETNVPPASYVESDVPTTSYSEPDVPVGSYVETNMPSSYAEADVNTACYSAPDVPIRSNIETNMPPASYAETHEPTASNAEPDVPIANYEPVDIIDIASIVSPEEVSIRTVDPSERWSDSLMSLPLETITSDNEPVAFCEASELYYTASSEVSLLSDTEVPERVPADEESLDDRDSKDDRKECVIAGHVAAMRERFESMTRTNTPCPDLMRSSSPSLDVFRNITPSPDRLG